MMLHRLVLQNLDAELRSAHGLSVNEFDVLITLFNAPDQRLGMSDLADRVLLSPAGTTHLVTRLESSRLVRREVDPTDRRRSFAVLTDDGELVAKQSGKEGTNEYPAWMVKLMPDALVTRYFTRWLRQISNYLT